MIGEKIKSKGYEDSMYAYQAADDSDMTKLGNLFYQTGRKQGADRYLWISPFVR